MNRLRTVALAIALVWTPCGVAAAQTQDRIDGGQIEARQSGQESHSFADQFKDIASNASEDAAQQNLEVKRNEIPKRSLVTPRLGTIRNLRAQGSKSGTIAAGRTQVGVVPSVLPKEQASTSNVVRIVLLLSLLAFLPALIISMTSFLRIVVVLSMIRHAFGMPETPPNQVLVSLALFLTAFTMAPTLDAVNSGALQPFLSGKTQVSDAMTAASGPLRSFMLKQVHDTDIKAVYDMSRKPLPTRAQDVDLVRLVPAFMLNELRVSFRIGFVVLLPFLLIDLVVSSILLAMGMMMVPPSTISLPLKVLMFVLIDGWSLVMQGLVGSIH